ncbi:small integral membrane protein 26-like [Aplochiton taeniatus]
MIKDIVKWNKRMSMVYAIGVWSMLGSYGYYVYTGGDEYLFKKSDKTEEEQPPNPNEAVFETAHSKTIIVYRDNFVPYSTRIANLFKSLTGATPTDDQGTTRK